MSRTAFAFTLWLVLAPPPLLAAPPDLEVPAEIRPAGQYVQFVPKTTAKAVTYIGLSNVDPVPAVVLKDQRLFLLDTRGLPQGRYRFAAVGTLGDEQARADFAVVIGDALPVPPPTPPGPVPNPAKVTAATFVYEKDQHVVPPPVLAALNKLNRERGIVATVFDKDVTDGGGEVPDQYRIALDAAKKVGLPALVVMTGSIVLRVVKDPKTEQTVLEAAK